jgi:hypothetical protein
MPSSPASTRSTAASSRCTPGRAFVGSQQVRRNWAEVFAGVPDFHAELLRSARQRQRTTSTSSTQALTTATTREKAIPGTSQ